MILVFFSSRATRRRNYIALNVPTIRFDRPFFRFKRFRSVFIYGIFFDVRFFTLFRSVPRRNVPRRCNVRGNGDVPFRIILARRKRTLTQSRDGQANDQVRVSMGHARRYEFSHAIYTSGAVTIAAHGFRICIVGRRSFAGLCQGI